MRLYLVRHGEALPKDVDPERGLSPDGKSRVEALAEFLVQRAGLAVPEIRHSPKKRAIQTAEIFHRLMGGKPGMVETPLLEPLQDVRNLALSLEHHETDLMLVGHLPHLARLASLLVFGDTRERIAFEAGAVLCLERQTVLGTEEKIWVIRWLMTPRLLERSSTAPVD